MHLVRQKVWFIKPMKRGFLLTTIEDARKKRKSCYHKKSNEVLIALLTTVMLKMCKKVITVIDTGGYISIFLITFCIIFRAIVKNSKGPDGSALTAGE